MARTVAEHLVDRSKLDLDLWGDVRDTLQALSPLLEAKADRTFLDAMLEQHRGALRKLRTRSWPTGGTFDRPC